LITEITSAAANEITPLGGITMFVKLPIATPLELKKSTLATCVAAEVLPMAISVDQFPPITTCGNATAPTPPTEFVVGTGELATVAGKENVVVTGCGVAAAPNPVAGLLVQTGDPGTPTAKPTEQVVPDPTTKGVAGIAVWTGATGWMATGVGDDRLARGICVKASP